MATVRSIQRAIKRVLQNLRMKRKYGNLSTQQIFTKIYEEGSWGMPTEANQKYYSGHGSHDGVIVDTYLEAIQKLLSSFEKKPNVVDLGYGDFYVGSKVRRLCETYIACDIVEPLIRLNKEKYKDLKVDFRVLDITRDELPGGDVAFIRQVFQHLSNKDISRALFKIADKYKYLVLTEHLPSTDTFTPNLDKVTGPRYRVGFDSGVVLTSAPFNLRVKENSCLCKVAVDDTIVRTDFYKLS